VSDSILLEVRNRSSNWGLCEWSCVDVWRVAACNGGNHPANIFGRTEMENKNVIIVVVVVIVLAVVGYYLSGGGDEESTTTSETG
jgi:hypothetical protein